MQTLTAEQIQAIVEVVQKSNPGPTLEQIALFAGLVVSVLTIFGILIAVIRFIAKVGAMSERITSKLETHETDITAAHTKIRATDATVVTASTDIARLDERVTATNKRIDDLHEVRV